MRISERSNVCMYSDGEALRAVGAGLTGALRSEQKKMLTHDAREISAYQSRACISSALKKKTTLD